METPDRKIPPEISANLRRWTCLAKSLRVAQVALGVLGAASALAVTAFMGTIDPLWIRICSFLAALSFGILAAFDIGGKANAARQACRHLDTAILRYMYVPDSSVDNLIDSSSHTASFRLLKSHCVG